MLLKNLVKMDIIKVTENYDEIFNAGLLELVLNRTDEDEKVQVEKGKCRRRRATWKISQLFIH